MVNGNESEGSVQTKCPFGNFRKKGCDICEELTPDTQVVIFMWYFKVIVNQNARLRFVWLPSFSSVSVSSCRGGDVCLWLAERRRIVIPILIAEETRSLNAFRFWLTPYRRSNQPSLATLVCGLVQNRSRPKKGNVDALLILMRSY